MTAHSDLESAVAAYHGGAFEYLPKPFDIDEAVEQVRRACRHRQAAGEASGVDNDELLSDPLARRLFFALLRENHRILRHAGVPLARIGPFHPDTVNRILRVPGLAWLLSHVFRPSLRGTYCSMAPDLPSGRTEIDAYNGYLVHLAGTTPCPLNRAVLAMVRRLERKRTLPHRGVWRELAHSVVEGSRA